MSGVERGQRPLSLEQPRPPSGPREVRALVERVLEHSTESEVLVVGYRADRVRVCHDGVLIPVGPPKANGFGGMRHAAAAIYG
jgi:hypothetical protein